MLDYALSSGDVLETFYLILEAYDVRFFWNPSDLIWYHVMVTFFGSIENFSDCKLCSIVYKNNIFTRQRPRLFVFVCKNPNFTIKRANRILDTTSVLSGPYKIAPEIWRTGIEIS